MDDSTLDALVRDACTIGFYGPKSDYRKRLLAWRDAHTSRHITATALAGKDAATNHTIEVLEGLKKNEVKEAEDQELSVASWFIDQAIAKERSQV